MGDQVETTEEHGMREGEGVRLGQQVRKRAEEKQMLKTAAKGGLEKSTIC